VAGLDAGLKRVLKNDDDCGLRKESPGRPKETQGDPKLKHWATSPGLPVTPFQNNDFFQQPLKPRSNPEGSACVGWGEVWAEKRISPLRCSR